MPFLNLNTFSALFIVSGMAFQRMLPRKAREFRSYQELCAKSVLSTVNWRTLSNSKNYASAF